MFILFLNQVERRDSMLLINGLPDDFFQVLVNHIDLCIGENIREHLSSIEIKH
jgi:hypothetical protein